jgi:outer membrane protein OmpA-like peptidoglycan-associated protein
VNVKILALALIAVLTAGCQSIDPYTGEQKTSNTAKGAGIGAVSGAILGAVVNHDDREKGALIGAASGAAIGGGVGYYMDRQEAALRQRLEGTGVRVQRVGNEIKLIMPGNITFDTGRSELKMHFYSTLDSVAIVINEFNKTRVDVSGHTDSTGGMELNQRLSEQRAASVGNYLVSQGVASGRINTVGYGPRYPIADNATASGRALNRRVEVNLQAMQ